jgi:hypothetical protein
MQSVLRWYIGQCELRSLKYGAKRHQVIHWAMGAKKFKIRVKPSSGGPLPNIPHEDALHHILNFLAHIAQCTNWGRFAPWYIGQGELRSLNMVERVLRWYIGQCELRSLKYGVKSPLVVHWARWPKKFKIWWKESSGGTCRFAQYFKLLSSHCPIYHMRTLCTIF